MLRELLSRGLALLRLLPRRGLRGGHLLRSRGLLLNRSGGLLPRLLNRSLRLLRGRLRSGGRLLRGWGSPSRSLCRSASGGTGNALDDGLAVVALERVDLVVFAVLAHAHLNAERDAVELLSVLELKDAANVAERRELRLADLLSRRIRRQVIDVLEDDLALLFAFDDGHLELDHLALTALRNLDSGLLEDDAVVTRRDRCPVAKGVNDRRIELDLSHSGV